MTYKYKVEITTYDSVFCFGSNSRNARKHLIENNADIVRVFSSKGYGRPYIVCSACRLMDCILVGTPPRK